MLEVNRRNARVWSMLGQRGTVCGKALPEILEENKDAIVITADLATLSGLERIKENFSKQFYNVGIAEQNMIGIAAGMSFEGDVVFATTYATFISMRCYEQIRHNLGYQKANVKVIGSAAGLAMGLSGNSHYSYEDLAIMRAIPNMIVLSPADASEAYVAIHSVASINAPVYMRLTGNLNMPIVYDQPYDFKIGKGITLRQGSDIALIATGSMVYEAIRAAVMLSGEGIEATVINMHTLKPIDEDVINQQRDKKLIVTIEEHSVIGGLGSAVSEVLSEKGNAPAIMKIGINDEFVHPSDYVTLLEKCGLTAEQISKKIMMRWSRT